MTERLPARRVITLVPEESARESRRRVRGLVSLARDWSDARLLLGYAVCTAVIQGVALLRGEDVRLQASGWQFGVAAGVSVVLGVQTWRARRELAKAEEEVGE